ncbi:MAG: phosphate ABC transporter, permease protein PstA, partial [Thiopseudomonas sp.]|nr:phosphate ABC transporter, permease protein PstA [Thiopseudomonas sp.]
MQVSLRKWFASGSPWVWLNAGAVAISVVLVLGLLGVIASRGLVHFWPASLQEYQYTDSSGVQMAVLGERVQREQVTAEQIRNSG